jgi:hypothetical protein
LLSLMAALFLPSTSSASMESRCCARSERRLLADKSSIALSSAGAG